MERALAYGSVVIAAGRKVQRVGAVGHVAATGEVVPHRIVTRSRVIAARAVEDQSVDAIRGVSNAGDVTRQCIPPSCSVRRSSRVIRKCAESDRGIEETRGIGPHCNVPDGGVAEAGRGVGQGPHAISRILGASGVVVERVIAHGRIVQASRETKKRIFALSSVLTGIASVRRWVNRLHSWRKRKADERECDENWPNCCVFGLSQRIHGSSFLFPRYVDSVLWGLGRGAEPSGANVPCLVSDPLDRC